MLRENFILVCAAQAAWVFSCKKSFFDFFMQVAIRNLHAYSGDAAVGHGIT